MAYFKLTNFNGVMPAIAPRLLNDSFAQVAKDVDFLSGKLKSIAADVDSHTLGNSDRKSVYLYEDLYWFEWDEDYIKAVSGPVPNDALNRVYWTGQGTSTSGYPRMAVSTSAISSAPYPTVAYKLGVPQPAATPTVATSGTATVGEIPVDVSYVYTLVTGHGEEGPPSAPSATVQLTSGETAVITFSSNFPTGDYYVTGAKKRIYRSNSGSNSTQFQFLHEADITDTTYTDNSDGLTLAEVIPTTTWIGPPDEDTALYPDGPLQGLTSLPNGVLAGFTGKRFCVSESFVPHAWPIGYRITLDEDIVAIASTAGGVAALTDGQPYFITGTDPNAMTATKIDLAQSCINKHSVVDMGSTVLYAGPDGLCGIDGATGEVLTENMISPKQWNTDFHPSNIKAYRYENTYVAIWEVSNTYGGWVFDPRTRETLNISTLAITQENQGGYTNPKDNELYLIYGDKLKKYRGAGGLKQLQYKSKQFVADKPLSMSWVSVDAETYPFQIKIYGDSVLIADYTVSEAAGVLTQTTSTPSGIVPATITDTIMRLPSNTAKVWEIEVFGFDFNEICLAQSIDEIRLT